MNDESGVRRRIQPASPRDNHVVYVHGTFAQGSRDEGNYAHGGGTMAQVLKHEFNAKTFSASDWDGGATEKARENAGKHLAQGLMKKFDGDERVHLVGHSHGGNVIGHALQELNANGRSVTSVTMLGTPHWDESVNPSWNANAMSAVRGRVTTFSSESDGIQTTGATLANAGDLSSPVPFGKPAKRTLDGDVLSPFLPHKVVNRDVTTFSKGSSARLDPQSAVGADHHSSLHDADVLENIFDHQVKRYQPKKAPPVPRPGKLKQD
jgi:hypothetical protein